ncbi:MAG: hypothetical protein JWM47_53 [Acidimicrobiales bacterium]|nr:hypothetical protein [Acidimicrobiales bacterium]
MTGIDTRDLISSERSLRELELSIGRKLEGLLHGDHQALLPGAGTEAGEGRRYQPGDDVRRIDWNLTARSGDIHVRDTIAERELETWFVVDGSASLDYGTARHEKRDLAMAVVAAFGFLTARPGNRTGVVLLDGPNVRVSPPRAGRTPVIVLLAGLRRRPRQEASAAPDVTLAHALRRVRLLAPGGGLVVVVSDLLDGSDWPRELRALGVRHDVIVAHLTDPREDDLPPVGLLTLVDPETGRRHEVQTSSRRFRQRYADAAAARRGSLTERLGSSRAAHFEVTTEGDWLAAVVRFVSARRRRR